MSSASIMPPAALFEHDGGTILPKQMNSLGAGLTPGQKVGITLKSSADRVVLPGSRINHGRGLPAT